MRRLGIRQPGRKRRPRLGPHDWRLSELEQELERSNSTLHQWRKRGWLQARWYEPEKCWAIWADEAELARLKARCKRSPAEITHQIWLEGQAAQRAELSDSPSV